MIIFVMLSDVKSYNLTWLSTFHRMKYRGTADTQKCGVRQQLGRCTPHVYFQFSPPLTHIYRGPKVPHLSEWMLYHCAWRVHTQESRRSSDSRGPLWRTARSLPRLRQQCVTQYSWRNDIFRHLRTSSTSCKAIRTSQRWHWFVSYTTFLYSAL